MLPRSAPEGGTRFPPGSRELDAIARVLTSVSADPHVCVVRGRPLPHIDPTCCRRLSDRIEHGDAVTFEPAARRWIALDVDGAPEPPCTTFVAEPEECVGHVVGRMPAPFTEASYWWQATGSAGVKPGVRCRAWFRLSRPVSDAEAKGWLKGSPADPSLFSPVAPHYVAAPILGPGVRDPMIRRHGIHRGLTDEVEVPADLPAARAVEAVRVDLSGQEPTETDLLVVAEAALLSRTVREIWAGERRYDDRSRAHYALAAALARAGCREPGAIHRVLIAYDERFGRDTSKILRPGYARATIGKALAPEPCR